MSLGTTLIVLPMTACLIWSAGSSRANPFCRQLRAIVEDAPRDFASVRGERLRAVPDDGGGDSAIRFAAKNWLPGASTCGVDNMRSDGDFIPSIYLCWFAPGRAGVTTVGRIAQNVVDCIGPRSAADYRLVELDRDRAAFDMQRQGFVLSVTAEHDRPVTLAISGK